MFNCLKVSPILSSKSCFEISPSLAKSSISKMLNLLCRRFITPITLATLPFGTWNLNLNCFLPSTETSVSLLSWSPIKACVLPPPKGVWIRIMGSPHPASDTFFWKRSRRLYIHPGRDSGSLPRGRPQTHAWSGGLLKYHGAARRWCGMVSLCLLFLPRMNTNSHETLYFMYFMFH